MCIVAALHQHTKQLMSGRRHKCKSLSFHKIDDVDKAGVELPLNYDENYDDDMEDDEEDEQEHKEHKEDSSMRMNVLTTIM